MCAQALHKMGLNFPDSEIHRLFDDADADGSGSMDFEEFQDMIFKLRYDRAFLVLFCEEFRGMIERVFFLLFFEKLQEMLVILRYERVFLVNFCEDTQGPIIKLRYVRACLVFFFVEI